MNRRDKLKMDELNKQNIDGNRYAKLLVGLKTII